MAFFFPFPNHPAGGYQRADRAGTFQLPLTSGLKAARSMGLLFWTPSKGRQGTTDSNTGLGEKKKSSLLLCSVSRAPVCQVTAHNKFYCNVINSWKEELGREVLTQAARAAALHSCGLCPDISTHLGQNPKHSLAKSVFGPSEIFDFPSNSF